MQIEFQKNGVKIIGARPCAMNDSDFSGRLIYEVGKLERFVREYVVTMFLYNIGIQVITIQFPEKVKNCSCRGRITTFSRHSSKRFRDLLLSVYVPNKSYLAITVTLPASYCFDLREVVILSSCLDLPCSLFMFDVVTPLQWFLLVKRFRQNLNRRCLAGVWRVELQKRQVPHLHIIGFGNDINDVSDYASAWFDAVDSLRDSRGVSLSCYDGFLIYGFVCKFVRSVNWVKYVAAHSAKHKEEQLGWVGRQWGVFNKDLISFYNGERCDMCPDIQYKVLRSLRRLSGYRGFNSNLFGSLQLFVAPAIIKRLVNFYSSPLPF